MLMVGLKKILPAGKNDILSESCFLFFFSFNPPGGPPMKPPFRNLTPFLSVRWWLLHTVAIATVYTLGHLIYGG
jgi:hypothetical protein